MKLATAISIAQTELNSAIQMELNSEDLSLQVSREVKVRNAFWPASLFSHFNSQRYISRKITMASPVCWGELHCVDSTCQEPCLLQPSRTRGSSSSSEPHSQWKHTWISVLARCYWVSWEVCTVLLEQSTAVWHSTHLCKQITAYTVVRSFLLLLSFLPFFIFYFNIKDTLKSIQTGIDTSYT